MSFSTLIQNAFEALERAHAPYSKFRVGAAIITNDDKIFTGCNVETSSYSLTICAERLALFKALSEGYYSFKAIAIVTDTCDYCPPCGACRQVLWEFAKDIEVVMVKNSQDYKVENLSQLLPQAFNDSCIHTNK